MDSKYKRLAKNSFWTLLGNSGSKVLGFLLLPLYTRWLGTSGFGESDLITTYSSFLVCVMTMCVSDAIFAFTKNQDDEKKRVLFSTSLSFIVVVLLLWLLVWIILDLGFSYFEVKNSFANNIWLIYGIVVTTFLQQYSQQFILSLEKIKLYSTTGIIHTLLTFVFSFWLIPAIGVRGYILAIIYSNLFTALYSFFLSRSYSFLSIKSIERSRIKDVLKYSIPLIPNGIMWWLVSAINRPIMEYNLSYADIGIFAVANRFPGVITMVFTVFSVALNISVFEEYGKSTFNAFFTTTFKVIFSIIVVLVSVINVLSIEIIRLFAAPEFAEAAKYMPILVLSAFFSCVSSYFGTTYVVVKESKYFFYSSLWGALTALILNLVLIPLFGLFGAALSVLFSFVVMSMTRYYYSLQFAKVSLLPRIIIYSLALISVAVVAIFVNNIIIRILSLVIPLATVYFLDGKLIIKFVKQRMDK